MAYAINYQNCHLLISFWPLINEQINNLRVNLINFNWSWWAQDIQQGILIKTAYEQITQNVILTWLE